MPGWSTVADMVSELEITGKLGEINFHRVTAFNTASQVGYAIELLQGTGQPTGVTFSGTAGVATSMTNSTTGALPINGNVSTDNRFLIDFQMTTPSTGTPFVAYLCDFLIYYPNLNINATPTTLDNTVTLPRYTNGIGVQAIVTVTTTLATTTPTLTFTYTDSANNSTTGAITAVATANANRPSTLWTVNQGGTGANLGPFIPMGSTGQGIKHLDSYTIASGTSTGAVTALLVKPLMAIPVTTTGVAQEKDMVFQFPSFPKIVDGACLGIILVSSGGSFNTNDIFKGRIRYGWG